MKNSILFVVAFFITIIFISCHKEGIGGEGTIAVEVRYYTAPKADMPVYIKYGTTSSPGYNLRDYDHAMSTDGNGKVKFEYLYKGDYFIYTGCPATYCHPTRYVRKGTAIKLKANNSTASIIIDLDSLETP